MKNGRNMKRSKSQKNRYVENFPRSDQERTRSDKSTRTQDFEMAYMYEI